MEARAAGVDPVVAIYHRALPQVYGYLLLRCRNTGVAEELTSAWRRRQRGAGAFSRGLDSNRPSPPATGAKGGGSRSRRAEGDETRVTARTGEPSGLSSCAQFLQTLASHVGLTPAGHLREDRSPPPPGRRRAYRPPRRVRRVRRDALVSPSPRGGPVRGGGVPLPVTGTAPSRLRDSTG